MNVRNPLYRLYEQHLRRGLEGRPRPRHVGVVCDGNRRWARENGFDDISHGHRMGARKIAEMLGWCDSAGVEMATIYLLSTENLNRDPAELEVLFEIITDVVDELSGPERNWRVCIVGALELLPDDQAKRLRAASERTEGCTGTQVNIAVGYGGRQEICYAVKSLLRKELADGAAGEQLVDSITPEAIGAHLYTSGQPDPDLLIRTSGEQRLSGFLLWQSAYSEIWFTEVYWPEFRRVDFLRALRDYSARHRRYGA
ncbi:isoprenyl transferase [Tomitella cavernea]|uniref:isoprenyl transferase n=1 Tax=Tomitella cavernea TaxID=1387982 RepID=UPI001905D680|nr:isoprenyl transferase [Tomitella cavernea]